MSVGDGTSSGRLLRRMLPLAVFAFAIIALYMLQLDVVITIPWLLTSMNVLLFITAVVSAFLAVAGFIDGGMLVLISLATGVLTFGIGNLAGPLLVQFLGPNAGVTAHNILAMGAGLQLLYTVAGSLETTAPREARSRVAIQALVATVAGNALIVILAARGLLPDFITADGTSSTIRGVVLTTAILGFGAAGIVAAVTARETNERFLRWYSVGLGFIALGLAAVSLGPVGSLTGWGGRLAQLVGQTYILTSLVVAVRQPVPAGGATGASLASSFRRVQSALFESRAQLGAAMRGMTDAVMIADAQGRINSFNDAFIEYHRFHDRAEVPASGSAFFKLFDLTHLDGTPLQPGERPGSRALVGASATEQEYRVRRVDTGEGWIGSYSYAPIYQEHGKLSGTVVVARDVTARKEAEADIARLLAAERRNRQRLEALHGVMEVAVSSMETDDVADLMLNYLIEHHHADMAGVWLAEGKELRLLRQVNFPLDVPEKFASIPMDASFDICRVYKTGEAAYASEPSQMSEEAKERCERGELNFGSYVIVPIRSGDRITGTLHLVWEEPRVLGEEDHDFYLSLGYEIGALLENTRLFALERDVAETLQETLIVIPSHVPGVEFSRSYQSATYEKGRVGGDFVDVFHVQGPFVGLSLGDVSGKGIAAAVTTSLIRTTMRVHALDGLPPAEVAMKTNAVMRHFTDTSSFVTLWFGLLNTKTGHLQYISAGHPPAIVLSASGDISELSTGGPILGAFDDAEYFECQSVLAEGDRLVLYSDGVTEARGPHGDFLQEAGLFDVLRCHSDETTDALASSVMSDVISYSAGVLRDDAAVLVVEAAELRNKIAGDAQG